MTQEPKPEFSFVVHPSAITGGGERERYELEASPAECTALAQRFDLLSLEFFRASVDLTRLRDGEGIRLQGRIVARVGQSCVVTLEPVVSDLDERFELLLLPAGQRPPGTGDIEEDFENFSGDEVDIGEIAAEELALALDPYPRSPEASAAALGTGEEPGESDAPEGAGRRGYRPFEALAGLKRSK